MRRSTDTLFRQWTLLKNLPRGARRKSTAQMRDALADAGEVVSLRTVQRDLDRLSGLFPIDFEVAGRTHFWFWSDDDKVLEIPTMDDTTALAFHLARPHVTPQLPPASLAKLAPYFSRATEVLRNTPFERWSEQVLMIRRGPELIPPTVPPGVQEAVCQALFDGHCFEVDYHSRSKETLRRHTVHPLGLVIRDGIFYLVCTLGEYTDVRHLALHRMADAVPLDRPVNRPADFSLKYYVERQTAFAYPVTPKPLQLTALFDADVAHHLRERVLAGDQALTPQPDGRVRLTATVSDTLELRWWLLGFGAGVEVVGPEALRGDIAEIVEGMARRYQLMA